MEDALAKLTPEQRQMIMAKAQQEANQQVMQEMMELMNKTCFDKCVGTTGDRLDSKEQACLASCQDRYFDARAAVQEAIQKRQSSGM
mmetsp:Transcript_1543/g.2797  ORF Transcript_1543/g.2797 Transcript_1543/m.2797 type:complete len:87 (-) Transcript_1543:216-476(-)